MNEKKEYSLIDYIIKKWFPILGILLVVGGISYLFYDGIWQNVSESVRLMIGFIIGVLFITGGYAFEDKLKGFGDVVIGGGVLIMYISLIFGSRLSSVEVASIPEIIALVIAFSFSVAIAMYAYQRKSKYILIIGTLGGYLTPYFMSGDYLSYLTTASQIKLPIFLIYFTSISLSTFFVANKMFLKGVGLLNSIGLFLGTFSLILLKGSEFKENIIFLMIFSVVVVIFHVGAMAVNSKKFEKENDLYLISGYVLPLVWFITFSLMFIVDEVSKINAAFIFGAVASVYFGAWYYLRNITESSRHFVLYIGGLVSVVVGLLQIVPSMQEFGGLLLTIISLVFTWLFYEKALIQREISAMFFGIAGVIINLLSVNLITFSGVGPFSGQSIYIILTLIPFVILSPVTRIIKHETDGFISRLFAGFLSYIAIVLIIILDLINNYDISLSYFLLVIPSFVLLLIGLRKKDYIRRNKYLNWSTALATGGFATTFLVIINRFYPPPENLMPFSTPESLIGVSVLGILFFVLKKYKEFETQEYGKQKIPFLTTFFFYLTLWSVTTHEVLGVFNLFGFDFSNPAYQGIRAFFVTLLWSGLALYMLFTSEKDNRKDKKSIGFALLMATFLKLIFYDLVNVNTNLKVFLFILIGLAVMYVSYNANKKEKDR